MNWRKCDNESIETYKDNSYEHYRNYDRFEFIADRIAKRGATGALLDIGCAKGEFIYYVKKRFSAIKCVGLEYSKELISLAKSEPFLNDVQIYEGDARSFNLQNKFDHVVMAGVLSIFDDYEQALERMISHICEGGVGYLFGGFTSQDIDVLIRFRNNYIGSKKWESGLNMFSVDSISSFLKSRVSELHVYPFEISVDLPKKENPVKSFTLRTDDGKRMIMNGANIIRQFYLIEFTK